MSQATISRTVVVSNPLGLHLRPAGMLAALASRFQAKIEIVRGSERVDGKSVMSIMLLAVEQGGELLIEAAGDDAQAAVDALASLVECGFNDEAPASDRNGDYRHDSPEGGHHSPEG